MILLWVILQNRIQLLDRFLNFTNQMYTLDSKIEIDWLLYLRWRITRTGNRLTPILNYRTGFLRNDAVVTGSHQPISTLPLHKQRITGPRQWFLLLCYGAVRLIIQTGIMCSYAIGCSFLLYGTYWVLKQTAAQWSTTGHADHFWCLCWFCQLQQKLVELWYHCFHGWSVGLRSGWD